MQPEVEAVAFDFGGVLSLPPLPEDGSRLSELSGLDPVTLQREYRRHRSDYDRGLIDGGQYWARVATNGGAAAHLLPIDRLIRADLASWTRINEAVLDWALGLREAGFKTAILSNMPGDLGEAIVARFSWMSSFDVRIFSCRVGSVKPEAEIYRACLEALATEAQRVLFIDDSFENVAAAKRLGMKAVRFTSFRDTREQLRQLGLKRIAAPAGSEAS